MELAEQIQMNSSVSVGRLSSNEELRDADALSFTVHESSLEEKYILETKN